jgi:hypothetical protein
MAVSAIPVFRGDLAGRLAATLKKSLKRPRKQDFQGPVRDFAAGFLFLDQKSEMR